MSLIIVFVCLFVLYSTYKRGFPGNIDGKESARNAEEWGLIPWRRKWQSIPVFLPGEYHRERSLVDYCHGVTESDMTEQLTLSLGHIKEII